MIKSAQYSHEGIIDELKSKIYELENNKKTAEKESKRTHKKTMEDGIYTNSLTLLFK